MTATEDGILDRALDVFRRATMYRKVGKLHDEGLAGFPIPDRPLEDHHEFEDICVRLVQHQELAAVGLVDGPRLPRNMALTRARRILGDDWFPASRRCIDGLDGGVRTVIEKIARSMRDESIRRRIAIEIDRVVDPMNFQIQLQLANEILTRYHPMLPPGTRAKHPALLLLDYRALLKLLAEVADRVQPYLCSLDGEEGRPDDDEELERWGVWALSQAVSKAICEQSGVAPA
jgi:hypothetical protein